MTPTPVGMRCPECSAERTRVVSGPAATSGTGEFPATYVLIALSVIGYLAEIAGGSGGLSPGTSPLISDFGLVGAAVGNGEWYRIVTSGFLHAGLTHIAFNMIALFFLGRILEPAIGTPRFVLIYFASLLAGSFGALLLADNLQLTVGASGAVFGLFGATFLIAYGRGIQHVARQLGLILGLNLLFTFSVSGISIGGHLGGLLAGLICGGLIVAGERGHLGSSARTIEYGTIILVGFIAAAGAIAVSQPVPGLRFALLVLPL